MDEPTPHLNSDRPISKVSDDSLNRSGFSKRLANAIRSVPGDESLVLALYGPWGSGKSSIKNMMLEELRSDDWTCPIILEFNPWRLGDESQLLVSFFSDVAKKLEGYSNSLVNASDAVIFAAKLRVEKWKEYGRYLSFAGTATALTIVAVGASSSSPILIFLGPVLKLFGKLFKHAENAAVESAKKDTKTLEDLRDDLRKSFESDDLKKNVLVIVDDLDRLSQSEIVLMVRLIKANSDFPRFVFLLLCEEDRVAKAHNEVAGGDDLGRKYLEKIVQIPFRVPAPNPGDIRRYFGNSLDRLISDLSPKDKTIWSDERDQERFSNLFQEFLKPYSDNLRSVNRYINALGLGMAAFIENGHFNANPVDVMAIEALKVFEPAAYEQLSQSSRSTLLGTGMEDLYSEEQTEAKNLVEAILEKAVQKERVNALVLLLFPTIHQDLGVGSYGDKAELQWRTELRICTTECFDRYFALDLRSTDLKESEFQALVRCVNDQKSLVTTLRQLGEDGKLSKLLFRLEGSCELSEFSVEDTITLFAELWNVAPEIPEYQGFVMSDDGRSQVFVLLRGHLRDRSEEERRKVIIGITERVKNFSSAAYMVARFESTLRSQEIARLAPSIATLDEAASIILHQIDSACEAGTLIDTIEQWPGMLDWWHKRAPDEAKEFLTTSLKLPRVMAAFLRNCSGRVSSDRRSFDYVDLKSVEEVVSAEEVEEATTLIDPLELETQNLKDLVSRFHFALARRRRGLSTNGSDMAFESER